MTMGVEHFGQRKQVGWVGEEVVAAEGCGMGWWASRRWQRGREWRAGAAAVQAALSTSHG